VVRGGRYSVLSSLVYGTVADERAHRTPAPTWRHGRGDRGRWPRPRRSTGRLIDHLRDRLVFPIKAIAAAGDLEILGWIGRRSRIKGDEANAGPKYLNTAKTDLFRKGNELYGFVEATPAIAGGAAAVVLVEGPMVAIAVTLAGDGDGDFVASLR
jgi:hypothetical protein